MFEIFQIDAFTSRLFSGNPAAVCPLDAWIDDELMQLIASENNLAETAFAVPCGDEFEIRWFTPQTEVDLCGHATLASAHAFMRHCGWTKDEITFHSRHSGRLIVRRENDTYFLNFPADFCSLVQPPKQLLASFDLQPVESYRGQTDFMLVYETRQQIEELAPDFQLLKQVDARGVIVTALGDDEDFVSRFFAPRVGIDEDPVTGSAHTTLIPFWSKRLGKATLIAKQISQRGGELYCKNLGDRTEIGGYAQTYLVGKINVSNR